MSRGGKREGAGRKPDKDRGVKVRRTTRLFVDNVSFLDEMKKKSITLDDIIDQFRDDIRESQ